MFIFQGCFMGLAVWFVYISNRVTSDISSSHPKTWKHSPHHHLPTFFPPPKMSPERQVEFSPEAQLRIASHQPLHTAPDKIEMRLSNSLRKALLVMPKIPATVEMKNIPNIPCLIGVWHTSIGAGFQPSTLWNKVIHIDNHIALSSKFPSYKAKIKLVFLRQIIPSIAKAFFSENCMCTGQEVISRS